MLRSLTVALLATVAFASEAETESAGVAADFTHNPMKRGTTKQRRRRGVAPISTLDMVQPELDDSRKHAKFHDWRDYQPDKYDGKDPYADCKFPENTEHLDTEEY